MPPEEDDLDLNEVNDYFAPRLRERPERRKRFWPWAFAAFVVAACSGIVLGDADGPIGIGAAGLLVTWSVSHAVGILIVTGRSR